MGSMKFILTTVMALGLAFAPAWVQADESLPVIKGIRVLRSGDDLGVEISADKKLEYTCSKMPQLFRVVIDLPRTEPGSTENVYRYKSIMISDIRTEKKTINGVMITRISVNLTEAADFTVRSDASDNGKLTLLFRKPARDATAGTAAAIPQGGAKGQPAQAKPAAPAARAQKVVRSPAVPGTTPPVSVTDVKVGAAAIDITSGGDIGEYRAFTLQKPGRLVIDIPGARSELRSIAVPANKFGVVKTRLAYFEGKLRIVFVAGTKSFPAYQVVQTGTGLRISDLSP